MTDKRAQQTPEQQLQELATRRAKQAISLRGQAEVFRQEAAVLEKQAELSNFETNNILSFASAMKKMQEPSAQASFVVKAYEAAISKDVDTPFKAIAAKYYDTYKSNVYASSHYLPTLGVGLIRQPIVPTLLIATVTAAGLEAFGVISLDTACTALAACTVGMFVVSRKDYKFDNIYTKTKDEFLATTPENKFETGFKFLMLQTLKEIFDPLQKGARVPRELMKQAAQGRDFENLLLGLMSQVPGTLCWRTSTFAERKVFRENIKNATKRGWIPTIPFKRILSASKPQKAIAA